MSVFNTFSLIVPSNWLRLNRNFTFFVDLREARSKISNDFFKHYKKGISIEMLKCRSISVTKFLSDYITNARILIYMENYALTFSNPIPLPILLHSESTANGKKKNRRKNSLTLRFVFQSFIVRLFLNIFFIFLFVMLEKILRFISAE